VDSLPGFLVVVAQVVLPAVQALSAGVENAERRLINPRGVGDEDAQVTLIFFTHGVGPSSCDTARSTYDKQKNSKIQVHDERKFSASSSNGHFVIGLTHTTPSCHSPCSCPPPSAAAASILV